MTSYYPLPPNIICGEDNNLKIKSSVSVLNRPNNSLVKSSKGDALSKGIYYSVYRKSETCWLKIDEVECRYEEFIEFKREDYEKQSNEMIVIVPMSKPNKLASESVLPNPISLRVDKSPIAERASYNFKIGNSTASYQGEYPSQLAQLEKGSFFSFDSLCLN